MPPRSLLPDESDLALLTDLYELTMAAGYFAHAMHDRHATFELFVRALPPDRSFLLVAGLEQLCHYVMNLRFDEDAVATLRGLPTFAGIPAAFFDYLRAFRFRGDLWAMPEGTVAFASEPLVRVTGGLLETQLLETLALTTISSQTMIASKAARIVLAARGRPVVDFGTRRAHGLAAGLLAARAALIAGCATTSNVRAATWFGVPPSGTMAHSWISAFPTEAEAFDAFAQLYPNGTTALVDTYDVREGIRNAARLGPRLAAIRLDSGDLAADARMARRMLDEAGCTHTKIILSGDLNEHSIDALLTAGVPADSFGVGTEMVTSRDAPSLSAVYKLVESADSGGTLRPRSKRSAGKATLGGVKQVFRRRDAQGIFTGDTLALSTESLEGEPLLVPVIRSGQPIAELPSLPTISARAVEQLASLNPSLRSLHGSAAYVVTSSERLTAL